MKQNIECTPCAARWATLLGKGVKTFDKGHGRTELVKRYPDTGQEVVSIQKGIARQRFRCDHCNDPIMPSEDCCAVGVYAPDAGMPDIPGWEADYIYPHHSDE